MSSIWAGLRVGLVPLLGSLLVPATVLAQDEGTEAPTVADAQPSGAEEELSAGASESPAPAPAAQPQLETAVPPPPPPPPSRVRTTGDRPFKLGIGLALGASNLGPHLTFRLSDSDRLSINLLPIISNDFMFVAIGAKYAHTISRRRNSSLYMALSLGTYFVSEESAALWTPAAGVGVLFASPYWDTFTPWIEIKLTGWITSGDFLLLPLPTLGATWFF